MFIVYLYLRNVHHFKIFQIQLFKYLITCLPESIWIYICVSCKVVIILYQKNQNYIRPKIWTENLSQNKNLSKSFYQIQARSNETYRHDVTLCLKHVHNTYPRFFSCPEVMSYASKRSHLVLIFNSLPSLRPLSHFKFLCCTSKTTFINFSQAGMLPASHFSQWNYVTFWTLWV